MKTFTREWHAIKLLTRLIALLIVVAATGCQSGPWYDHIGVAPYDPFADPAYWNRGREAPPWDRTNARAIRDFHSRPPGRVCR